VNNSNKRELNNQLHQEEEALLEMEEILDRDPHLLEDKVLEVHCQLFQEIKLLIMLDTTHKFQI